MLDNRYIRDINHRIDVLSQSLANANHDKPSRDCLMVARQVLLKMQDDWQHGEFSE
jgi:hypothetical protein